MLRWQNMRRPFKHLYKPIEGGQLDMWRPKIKDIRMPETPGGTPGGPFVGSAVGSVASTPMAPASPTSGIGDK
eukprot:1418491-Pyramimonas_sp.AAC.1